MVQLRTFGPIFYLASEQVILPVYSNVPEGLPTDPSSKGYSGSALYFGWICFGLEGRLADLFSKGDSG